MRIQQSNQGFTLIEIMIVVAIIAMLAVMSITAFHQARIKSQTGVCLNNLRQIDGVFEQYYLEHKVEPASLALLSPNYISRPPECPAHGSYALPTDSLEATCDIGSTLSANFPHDLTP